jgi:hypothetical protein
VTLPRDVGRAFYARGMDLMAEFRDAVRRDDKEAVIVALDRLREALEDEIAAEREFES